MNWYYVESNTRPATIDETSSKKYVYVRRNIEQRERTGETGETETYWAWEEQKIPKGDYLIYKIEMQNAANLDYLAMMSDIDLDNEEEGE